MTVLITTPSFGQYSDQPWRALAEEGLEHSRPTGTHPLSAADLAAEARSASALIVGLDEVSATVFDAAPELKVVAKHGVGIDNIDCEAARSRGVRVVNAPGTNTGAVADLTWAMILAAARQLVAAHNSTVDGQWGRFFGPELSGKTLGILGFGRIGQAVARRARGFDMTVLAHDPYAAQEVFGQHGVTQVELARCVEDSDVLTLHLPLPDDGRPLLGRAELGMTKRGAILVNTARGGLVDEQALAELLHQGHLHAAAIDVFSKEPPRESPLLSAPGVVLTPHMGAYSHQANAAMGTTVVRDVARVLRGAEPVNGVV